MRQAAFVTVFCGIETPELDALKSIVKEQNARCRCSKAYARSTATGSK